MPSQAGSDFVGFSVDCVLRHPLAVYAARVDKRSRLRVRGLDESAAVRAYGGHRRGEIGPLGRLVHAFQL